MIHNTHLSFQGSSYSKRRPD